MSETAHEVDGSSIHDQLRLVHWTEQIKARFRWHSLSVPLRALLARVLLLVSKIHLLKWEQQGNLSLRAKQSSEFPWLFLAPWKNEKMNWSENFKTCSQRFILLHRRTSICLHLAKSDYLVGLCVSVTSSFGVKIAGLSDEARRLPVFYLDL